MQAMITNQVESRVKKAKKTFDWAEVAEWKKENVKITIQKNYKNSYIKS